MACFHCSTTEIFLFLLNYRQRKVDLNTSKSRLFSLQYDIYLRPAILYENFIFTQKYAFEGKYCYLTFSFEGKPRKHDISVKRKHNNKNMIFSVLLTNFCKRKILFFMQWQSLISEKHQLRGSSFFSKYSKFDVDFRIPAKNREESFCFLDNCIWFPCGKSSQRKNTCRNLNHGEQLLTLASTVSGCVSAFASLVGIPIEITNSPGKIKFA